MSVDVFGARLRPGFRWMLVASALLHAAAVATLGFAPERPLRPPPGVVAVELVAAPETGRAPAPPAPRAGPAPKPKPEPRPVPPVEKKVVIPEEPAAPQKASKRRREVVLENREVEEAEYGDVLAQLRAEAGESRPAPPPDEREASAEPATGAAAGSGRPLSPEVSRWMRAVKIRVRKNWVVPPGFRTQALETHVRVDLDAGGRVVGEPRITRSSGNPWFDDGVLLAIRKSSPLPAPPEADAWPFVFRPEDSF